MRTKYQIEIDGAKSDIPQDCIKNWDEIQCVYKRTDFSGVTRSFSTKFEFVGEMYDALIALYLRDGITAEATITLLTINNEWKWDEQFSCSLDFSSATWDGYIFSINCIDDSLAAIIKARKGTKYELSIGEDLASDARLMYDRIDLKNTCVHEIMGDKAADNSENVLLYPSELKRLPTNTIGDGETYEGSPILFQDQTDERGSCFLETINAVKDLEIFIEIRDPYAGAGGRQRVTKAKVYLMSYKKNNPDYSTAAYNTVGTLMDYESYKEKDRTYLGLFPSFDALKAKYPTAPDNSWALVGDDWTTAKEGYVATDGNATPREWIAAAPWTERTGSGGPIIARGCSKFVFRNKFTFSDVPAGTCYALFYELEMTGPSSIRQKYMVLASEIKTSWRSRGKVISIDAHTPKAVIESLLDKMCDRKLNISAQISDTDSRIEKTWLFAAESIRGIPGAKFYTSFNEYCDWMEAVFGYTYYIGARTKAQFSRSQQFKGVKTLGTATLNHTVTTADGNDVFLIENTPYFAVLGADGNYYSRWNGSEAYNDTVTGKARLDTLFYDSEYSQGIYFNDEYVLQTYLGDVSRGTRESQTIYFTPRGKLFAGDNTIRISQARDFKYTINTALAYSSVTVGYEKQDYEATNGRDEWNFTNQYTTGIDRLDKNLSLLSKYRADCYGFEFLAQERAKDTTDNKSDKTVFFAYCSVDLSSTTENEDTEMAELPKLKINRADFPVTGALSQNVFNGAYAPHLCTKTNGAYIAAAICPMNLKYASTEGNSEVSINGSSVNSDIVLNEQLFTLGEIEFSSDEIANPDTNAIYEVSVKDVIYRGFLKEVSFKYAREEAVTYKLIVKEVEP